MKFLLLLPLFLLSMLSKSQTGTYFADKMRHYPSIYSNQHSDTAINMRISLFPDSIMVIHNRDSNATLSLKMIAKLEERNDESGEFKSLIFVMKNIDPPFEDLIMVLVYRRKDISLQVVGITDGENRLLLYIKQKEEGIL